MVTASRFKSVWATLGRPIGRILNWLRGRTPDGFLAPPACDGIIEDEEAGITITYFETTLENAKALREEAKRRGLITDAPNESQTIAQAK